MEAMERSSYFTCSALRLLYFLQAQSVKMPQSHGPHACVAACGTAVLVMMVQLLFRIPATAAQSEGMCRPGCKSGIHAQMDLASLQLAYLAYRMGGGFQGLSCTIYQHCCIKCHQRQS